MLLNRPLQMLAVTAGAGSMMLAVLCSSAQAQRPAYQTASHGRVAVAQSISDCCPCPPAGGYGSGTVVEQGPTPQQGQAPYQDQGQDQGQTPIPAGQDLPQVADLGGGGDFASAPQSAVPNAIGDSMGGCFTGVLLGSGTVPFCPGAGNGFRISENNSALPQRRVYYNYRYFDNALKADFGGGNAKVDVQRHELGMEYPIMCNMASFGFEVPVSHTINSELLGNGDNRDLEYGNVSVYFKSVLLQDCCKTVTAGLGIQVPTGDDLTFDDGQNAFLLENDVITLSPYLAMLYADPCGNSFLHAFAQVDFPTESHGVDLNGAVGRIDSPVVMYLDASFGYWLNRDCCGNGVAAIFELHYASNLEGDQIRTNGVDTLTSRDYDFYNTTVGATVVRGCWDVTPAVVFPLLDRPDRGFDWEFALNVNRRF